MNYLKIYNSLIEKALNENRKKFEGVYYEAHHIKPKSLFPKLALSSDNLVLLTPREHYVAHWLLLKIYPGTSMLYAFINMSSKAANGKFSRDYKVSSRVYEKLRKKFSDNNPSKTIDAKKKISAKKKGDKHHYYKIDPENHPCYDHNIYIFCHDDGRVFKGTPYVLVKTFGLSRPKVTEVIKGTRKRTGGWRLGVEPIQPRPSGNNHPSADPTMFCWYNPYTGEGLVGTRQDFIKYTNFSPSSVHKLATNVVKTLKKWTKLTKEDI